MRSCEKKRNCFNSPPTQFTCMEGAEAAEYVISDPNAEVFEKEFHCNVTKGEEEMTISSAILGVTRGLLRHSDVSVRNLTVYDEEEDKYEDITLEEFEGDRDIVSGRFIGNRGLLKIGSKPRQGGGYGAIVSSQKEVNIDRD